jgi:hypothetical protein
VGGLAHYIEDEGIATTQISLIREHTEIIKPPRALWVSFDLGRPLGVPNDAEFQLSVLKHALKLFEAPSGPVLEDFPEDAPDTKADPVQVACPVSFQAISKPLPLADQFKVEINQMHAWYDIARKKQNRTTIGISGLSSDAAAQLLTQFIDAGTRPELLEDPTLPDKLRLACEDIKAYYFEAVSAQPGQPTDSKNLADWFWGETSAAIVINAVREICLDDPSGKLMILGKLLLVPRGQLHRFTKPASPFIGETG